MTIDEGFGASWYCAALRRELSPGRAPARAFCGRSLVLSTSEEGLVTAEIEGRPAPVRVQDDVVFVWHGPAGEAPSYELPSLDREGFTRSTYDFLETRTTPPLIMRDLADYEHFEAIHRYRRVVIEEPFSAEGARCALKFSFDWPFILGSGLVTMRVHTRSVCIGLGYQVTNVISWGGTLLSRHRVMPTPTEGGLTRVTLGMEIQVRSAPRLLPKIGTLSHAIARRAFARDTAADAAGWQAMSEQEAAGARGPLAAYWAWARQFHAETRQPMRARGYPCST